MDKFIIIEILVCVTVFLVNKYMEKKVANKAIQQFIIGGWKIMTKDLAYNEIIVCEHTETGEILTLMNRERITPEILSPIGIEEGNKLIDRKLRQGKYRHFKNKIYTLKTVATRKGEAFAIYQAEYGERKHYARPLEMFASEVDRVKYPEVTQKYRLEEVNG